MMIALLVLALGLILLFVPASAPNPSTGDKVNKFGLVLVFCGVFFALAAFSGRSLRVADGDTSPANYSETAAVLDQSRIEPLRRWSVKTGGKYSKEYSSPQAQRDVIDIRKTIARVLFTSGRHTSREGDGLKPQPAARPT